MGAHPAAALSRRSRLAPGLKRFQLAESPQNAYLVGQRGTGGLASEMAAGERLDAGVRLIVLYKVTKAAAEVLAALALVAIAASGELALLRSMADALRLHAASPWSLAASTALGELLSPHGSHLLELGLLLDGTLTTVEGLSLRKGVWWGPWLVVLATGLPLPWELLEIARTLSPLRVALALANAAVVVYLARKHLHPRRP